MNKEVGAFEAKTHFSSLLERAENGEKITITRRGKPVAKLVPVEKERNTEEALKAFQRIRERAKTTGVKKFDWNEWKKYRDEGRR
jgi:prevent-host-death family protein